MNTAEVLKELKEKHKELKREIRILKKVELNSSPYESDQAHQQKALKWGELKGVKYAINLLEE